MEIKIHTEARFPKLYLELFKDNLHYKYCQQYTWGGTVLTSQLDRVGCWRLFLGGLVNFRPCQLLQKTSMFHMFLAFSQRLLLLAFSSPVKRGSLLCTWSPLPSILCSFNFFLPHPVFSQGHLNLTAKIVLCQLNSHKDTMNFLVSHIVELSDTTIAAGIILQLGDILIKESLSPTVLFLLGVVFTVFLQEDRKGIVLRRVAFVDLFGKYTNQKEKHKHADKYFKLCIRWNY